MNRPFQLFLVPKWQIVTCFLLSLLFASVDRIMQLALDVPTIPARDAVHKMIPMAFFYLAYGCARVFCSTPWLPTKFTQFLLSCPWTNANPLPFEPAQLSWQDAFIVLLSLPVSAIAGLAGVDIVGFCLMSAAIIAGSYLFCTAIMLRAYGWVAHSYTIVLGLTLIPAYRYLPQPLPAGAALATLVLLYIVATKGRKRAFEKLVADSIKPPEIRRDPWAWWPGAVTSRCSIAFREVLMLSGYVGLFSFLICNDAYTENPRGFVSGFILVFLLCASVGGIIRIFLYVVPPDKSGSVPIAYCPPIGAFGRLATGRLIIPGYDKVFVAPLCAVIIPLLFLELLLKCHVTPPMCGAVALALVSLITLGAGPSLKNWQLTGQHRMVNLQPKTLLAQQRKKLRL